MNELSRFTLSLISLLLSITIFVGTIILEIRSIKKRKGCPGCYFEFVIIGFISTVYYFLVLFFPEFNGHDWSVIRSSVIYTELAWWTLKKLGVLFNIKSTGRE
jgi:hypothetical protein